MEKLYVVRHEPGDFDNVFIVKANNQKEAIDIVFTKHFEWWNKSAVADGFAPFRKSELSARSLDREFAECGYGDGSYVCLN